MSSPMIMTSFEISRFSVDMHQQRLARLAWELETRKKLHAQAQVKLMFLFSSGCIKVLLT